MDFPALDVHAHIDPKISARELLATRAVVLAATRSFSEFEATLSRDDPLVLWGVGVHPGVPAAIAAFDVDVLRMHLDRAPLLSEVGLDRRSAVRLIDQKRAFRQALEVHDEVACIASVHSAGCTAEVLEALDGHRCETIILHWWRGTAEETRAAVSLGCYFSFNPRDRIAGSVFDLVPPDRVLTETDHPFGDTGRHGAKPGGTDAVEERMNKSDPAAARQTVWSNFRGLVESARILDRLPSKIAGLVSAVPSGER